MNSAATGILLASDFNDCFAAVNLKHSIGGLCAYRPDAVLMVNGGFRHKAAIAEVGANVRSWVYTGHSQVAKRNSAVFGVNGGF